MEKASGIKLEGGRYFFEYDSKTLYEVTEGSFKELCCVTFINGKPTVSVFGDYKLPMYVRKAVVKLAKESLR